MLEIWLLGVIIFILVLLRILNVPLDRDLDVFQRGLVASISLSERLIVERQPFYDFRFLDIDAFERILRTALSTDLGKFISVG